MNLDESALNIFTDGSSYSSPRVGGVGMIFVTVGDSGHEEVETFLPVPSYKGATNNQMELQACINALQETLDRDLSAYSKIYIYTDSAYVVENYEIALFQWSRSGWMKWSWSPVLNAEQWKKLIKLTNEVYQKKGKKVLFKWVKWHAKSQHNKMVDKLAKQSAKTPGNERVSVTRVRRKKIKDSKTVPGIVTMQWQRVSIYIVTDEYLKLPKLFKYKYQVLSRRSPFYGCTDTIFSEVMLSAGHSYQVRLNTDPWNPRIVKKFNEIEKKEPSAVGEEKDILQ